MEHVVVKKVIQELEGKIAFMPGYGNAGDALIAHGTYCFFREIGFTPILTSRNELREAGAYDAIVLGGGGGFFVSQWADPSFINDLLSKSRRLVVLPQSVSSCEELLKSLRPQDSLILREKQSYDFCLSLGLECDVLLDHDMALYFTRETFNLKNIKKLVIRFTKRDFQFLLFYGFNYLNSRFTRKLVTMRTDSESIQETFRSWHFLDISRSTFITSNFDDEESVRQSVYRLKILVELYDELITDRLHVAIVGYLLGKRVEILDQSYGKISAVRDFSKIDFESPNELGI